MDRNAMKRHWKIFASAAMIAILIVASGCIGEKRNITSNPSQYGGKTANKVVINNSVIIQHSDGTATIPIKNITKNKAINIRTGDKLTNNIEYEVNGIKIGFKNYGYGLYPYIKSYVTNTEVIINNTQVNINIGPNMNPYDNVIEGFMFYDFLPNGTVLVYIYVDEDWKKRIKPTKIVWGKNDNWNNPTFSKKFNFHKVADGIYRDIITDDPNRWFANYTRSYGGVKVGKPEIYLGI